MSISTADLESALKSGDFREQLIAIRDVLIHELTGHRCPKCEMSMMRTGETAALALRLTKTIEMIAALPDPNAGGEEQDELAKLRTLHAAGGVSDPEDRPPSRHGTKAGERRQGGRRPSRRGEPAS